MGCGAVMGLRCCTWAFFSWAEQGLLFIVVTRLLIVVAALMSSMGSRHVGFSSRRPRVARAQAQSLWCMDLVGLPRGKTPGCQCRRRGTLRFHPWAGKIPWRRACQPTLVFLPGESLDRERSLVGPGSWGRKESDTTEAT